MSISEEPRCMMQAAYDLMPLVLEQRTIIVAATLQFPSANVLATTFIDAYPDSDLYGLWLACKMAASPCPLGA